MATLLSWINELYTHWQKDRVATLAAALAYYTVFSLAPILLICISLVGILFGEEAAKGQVLEHIGGLLGAQAATQIQEMIQNVNRPATALIAQIISVFILIFSASAVFSEIQEGLNNIWGVKSDSPKHWFAFIKNRFLAFVMILVSALLLLISLVLSTFLATLSSHINYFLGANIFVMLALNYCFSFLIVTLLFAMMFKNLPDVELPWKSVWIGALITSFLFNLGKVLIGFYLHRTHIVSVFGAAGSLIVLLIWVYYSAQIFFLGAEITKIYSLRNDLKIRPR